MGRRPDRRECAPPPGRGLSHIVKHGFLPTSPDRRLEAVSGRLTGVTGGMQIILPARLREACGAGAEPAQFGRQGCRCLSFGRCHVFNGEAPRGRKDHASLRRRSDRGTEAGAAVSCGEEDDMSDTTPALDEAYERIAAASFELACGLAVAQRCADGLTDAVICLLTCRYVAGCRASPAFARQSRARRRWLLAAGCGQRLAGGSRGDERPALPPCPGQITGVVHRV